jgi:hypothetical protein
LVLPSFNSQENTIVTGSAWTATERSRNTDVTVANMIFFNMIKSFSCFSCVHFSIEEEFRFACPQRAVARHHRLLFWFLDSAYSDCPLWSFTAILAECPLLGAKRTFHIG